MTVVWDRRALVQLQTIHLPVIEAVAVTVVALVLAARAQEVVEKLMPETACGKKEMLPLRRRISYARSVRRPPSEQADSLCGVPRARRRATRKRTLPQGCAPPLVPASAALSQHQALNRWARSPTRAPRLARRSGLLLCWPTTWPRLYFRLAIGGGWAGSFGGNLAPNATALATACSSAKDVPLDGANVPWSGRAAGSRGVAGSRHGE